MIVRKGIGNPRFDHCNSCYKHKLENYVRCLLSLVTNQSALVLGIFNLPQKMFKNRYDLRVLITLLVRICKWSKNRGGKHSQLISELSDAQIVRMRISRTCL